MKRNIVFALLVAGLVAGTTASASAAPGRVDAPNGALVEIDARTGTATDARTGRTLEPALHESLVPSGNFVIDTRTGALTTR